MPLPDCVELDICCPNMPKDNFSLDETLYKQHAFVLTYLINTVYDIIFKENVYTLKIDNSVKCFTAFLKSDLLWTERICSP